MNVTIPGSAGVSPANSDFRPRLAGETPALPGSSKEFTICDLRFTMALWIWPTIWNQSGSAFAPRANAPAVTRIPSRCWRFPRPIRRRPSGPRPDCGQIFFGENKVQEAKAKIPLCPGKLRWHFIGHLQSNKCRDAVELFEMIQSVDSLSLAQEINKRAEQAAKTMPVLMEVNVAGEASKFGYQPERLLAELKEINALPRLGDPRPDDRAAVVAGSGKVASAFSPAARIEDTGRAGARRSVAAFEHGHERRF